MRINNNLMAMNTHRQLQIGTQGTSRAMEKLSSGLRINRAADDAAGLSISEKMRGQIRGLAQASRNAQDGVSLVQTFEGALNEVSDILARMKELNVQKANGTYQTADTCNIDKELSELASAATTMISNTSFNGISMATSVSIAMGHDGSDTLTINAASSVTIAAGDAISVIEGNIDKVNGIRAQYGAYQNRLEASVRNIDTTRENLQAAESRVRDTDMAKEMMEFTKNSILLQASQSMLAQANQAPQGVLQLLR